MQCTDGDKGEDGEELEGGPGAQADVHEFIIVLFHPSIFIFVIHSNHSSGQPHSGPISTGGGCAEKGISMRSGSKRV